MNGIKIVRQGKSIDNALVRDTVMSTEFETLPIAVQQPFDLFVIPAQGTNKFGFTFVRIAHNLHYVPPVLAWIDVPNGDDVERSKLPYYVSSENYIYQAVADEEYAYITATSGAPSPTDPSFIRTGYIYVFKKDLRQVNG